MWGVKIASQITLPSNYFTLKLFHKNQWDSEKQKFQGFRNTSAIFKLTFSFQRAYLLLSFCCNSRLHRSHMRHKKYRPYNHWLKSQGHYLLCFSTSKTVGANSVRLRHETRTRYSLKNTTKISPPPHSRK